VRKLLTRLRSAFAVADGPGTVRAAPALSLRRLVRRFAPYARPYRRWLAVTLVLVAVAAALQTAEVWLFKVLVDDVLVPRDLGAFPPLAFAFVALALASGSVSFTDDVLSTWIGERFVLDLRTRVFRHLQGLSLDFFDRRRLGDLTARLTGDVGAIETLVLSGVADAVSHVLRIAFVTAALLYLRWELALVALLAAPFFWLSARRFSRAIKRASREKRRRAGAISAVAEESLANVQLVQAYGVEAREVERFHHEALGAYAAEMAAARLRALFRPLIDLLEVAGALLVVAVGTWEVSRGRLSVGGLIAFLAYVGQLYSPVRGLSRLSNSAFAAAASAERIAELLDAQPTVREHQNPVRLPRARGDVQLDGVSFRYPGTRRFALCDVSFRAERGETIALVGPSGAGKSTLAKLLLRFYDPAHGRVLLDGHDLRDLALDDVRGNVTLLLQETLVFDASVRDNIALGRHDEAALLAAARDAGVDSFVRRLDDGFDTPMGQRGRLFSGGERQRVAIARALLRDAPVLVLDEPTTSLDREAQRRVLEPLQRLIEGRTTIVVSHDLLTVRNATRILVLDGGEIVEEGTHDDLVARGRLYTRLWRLHHPDGATVAL
jgi:ATP-binding cassette, subfamily B, bacterial